MRELWQQLKEFFSVVRCVLVISFEDDAIERRPLYRVARKEEHDRHSTSIGHQQVPERQSPSSRRARPASVGSPQGPCKYSRRHRSVAETCAAAGIGGLRHSNKTGRDPPPIRARRSATSDVPSSRLICHRHGLIVLQPRRV